MRVFVPSPLLSYTGGQKELEAEAASLAQLLASLDARHPGLRHRIVDEQDRIRRHIRLFVNSELARTLEHPLENDDEVMIVAALSGG
jgi:sulfur-carrier protein